MPLHEINAIEYGGDMYINYAMKNAYELKPGDVLIAELKRHFDENKKLKQEINVSVEISLSNTRWINFSRDLPEIANKYDIKEKEFVEIIYKKLRRGSEEIEIYPGETKQFLDFKPEE